MRTIEMHFHLKKVKRSSGRSSVAAAAYRSASRLVDERTGEIHDYTRKQGVEHTRIYTPDNAPEWANDRAKLWNAVEVAERKSNSQVANEFVLAFPSEFNEMQRRECGDKVARELMDRYNCAVDIAYHVPDEKGLKEKVYADGTIQAEAVEQAKAHPNYHAHIMFTTRSFDNSRETGFERTKYRDLSQDKIKVDGKNTTKGSVEVSELREFAAKHINIISERENIDIKTEHLSFKERGIDKEPTKKIGLHASQMEDKGQESKRGDLNREIKASNDNLADIERERNVLDFEYARAKKELEELANKPTPTNEKDIRELIANRHPDFDMRKDNLSFAMEEHKQAKADLENIGFMDKLFFKREEFEQAVFNKQCNIDNAQMRFDELSHTGYEQYLRNSKIDYSSGSNKSGSITIKETAELEAQNAKHEGEQKELKALEAALSSRSNMECVIGAITGKTREQRGKIEQLRESIKSFEHDKKLQEQNSRQAERDSKQHQETKEETKQAEHNQARLANEFKDKTNNIDDRSQALKEAYEHAEQYKASQQFDHEGNIIQQDAQQQLDHEGNIIVDPQQDLDRT